MDKLSSLCNPQPRNAPYVCTRCQKQFQLYGMYACYHGHYLCKTCYTKISSGGSSYNIVPTGDSTETENGDGEYFVPSHMYLPNELGAPERNKFMFPNPSAYQHNTIDKHSSLISLATIYKPSLLHLCANSRKPIICPQYDCRKTIAVSSLDAHFQYEHKKVVSVVTQLETRNCIEFNVNDLRGKNCNMCLVLLHLEEQSDGDVISIGEEENYDQKCLTHSRTSRFSRSSGVFSRPFFILVAAKISSGKDDVTEVCGNEYQANERVFFYVSSNIVGNYSYTIAVSTKLQNIRIKYFGPLLSVNEDFKKLCEDGKGLVLNHHHINGMSGNCCCPVNLDLILHQREDQCISVSE